MVIMGCGLIPLADSFILRGSRLVWHFVSKLHVKPREIY